MRVAGRFWWDGAHIVSTLRRSLPPAFAFCRLLPFSCPFRLASFPLGSRLGDPFGVARTSVQVTRSSKGQITHATFMPCSLVSPSDTFQALA